MGPDPPDDDRRRLLTLIGQARADRRGPRRGHPPRRGPHRPRAAHLAPPRALGGGFLIGLSTFQAEFDFGVPQFDLLFQPLLIALAACIALVSARLWGGRGRRAGRRRILHRHARP